MPKMPVMDVVVKILESEGVDVCFGIHGAEILPLYKSLSKSTKIKHLTMRHEEGATHAADGWARITGKVGVAIGTSGPAGTNMITGLHTCQGDSIRATMLELAKQGSQAGVWEPAGTKNICLAAPRNGGCPVFRPHLDCIGFSMDCRQCVAPR